MDKCAAGDNGTGDWPMNGMTRHQSTTPLRYTAMVEKNNDKNYVEEKITKKQTKN